MNASSCFRLAFGLCVLVSERTSLCDDRECHNRLYALRGIDGTKPIKGSLAEKTYADWSRFDPANFDPQHSYSFQTLVFMIERRWGRDLLPYMSPTGGGYSQEFDRANPAWDYRYWLRELAPGQEVVIRSRVVYKLWAGHEDILREYDRWHKELSATGK